MSGPLVLKVGGSVFAREEAAPRLDRDCLERLASELEASLGSLVVVHGAGRYPRSLLPADLEGSRLPPGARIAVRRLRRALDGISAGVAATWSRAGLPVERVADVDGEEIGRLLARRRLPLLRGDVVETPDGYRVVSSDLTTEVVALALGAARVVWATDVDGVLRSPEAGAEVVDSLTELSEVGWIEPAPPAGRSTGEMRSKVMAALRLARRGIPSWIVNGRADGRVAAALDGRSVPGTRVEALSA